MYTPEYSLAEAAGVLAGQLALDKEFTVEFLEKALAGPVTNETKQAEFKLAGDVRTRLSNPRLYAVFSAQESHFSKAVIERNPGLVAYQDQLRQIVDSMRRNLATEALDWAKELLSTNPSLAASLCTSETAVGWMDYGMDVLFCGATSQSKKKQDHESERLFRRYANKMPRIFEAIKIADCASDPDACLEIAVRELYGSLRPIMLYSLALTYGYYIVLGLLVFCGRTEEQLEVVAGYTLIDDLEFSESVLAKSSILPQLGPVGQLLIEYDFDVLCIVSGIIGYHRFVGNELGAAIQSIQDEHQRKEREWARTEKSLNKSIEAHAKSIAALEKGSADATTKSLLAELAASKDEIAKLRDLVHRQEDRISRLQAEVKSVEKKTVAIDEEAHSALPSPSAARSVVQPSAQEALAYLQGIKGIVVGGHPIFLQKLAQALPEWSLHGAEETTVDEAYVLAADLVVFFTNHCSHTLTQSVLKITRRNQIPVAYAYKVNPDAFYVEVAKQAQRHQARSSKTPQ